MENEVQNFENSSSNYSVNPNQNFIFNIAESKENEDLTRKVFKL